MLSLPTLVQRLRNGVNMGQVLESFELSIIPQIAFTPECGLGCK